MPTFTEKELRTRLYARIFALCKELGVGTEARHEWFDRATYVDGGSLNDGSIGQLRLFICQLEGAQTWRDLALLRPEGASQL